MEKLQFINSNQLKEYISSHKEDEYEIIDVRQPFEYEQGHIAGAKLIPVNTIESRMDELDPNKELIFYCKSGSRSIGAGLLVSESDITPKAILNLAGGLAEWEGEAIADWPQLKSFPEDLSLKELLLNAIELEKGAMNFYIKVGNEVNSTKFSTKLEEMASMEVAHAKTIYNYYKKLIQPNEIPNFEEFFDSLPGDIVESGDNLTKLLERAKRDNSILEISELAIEIEYKAYDLYKNLYSKEEDPDKKKTFLYLADQEKVHIRRITKWFDDYME